MNIDEYKKLKQIGLQDTFQFKCDGCGECCKNREDILLTAYDIIRIRKFLKISLVQLMDKYCEAYIGGQSKLPIIRLRPAAECVFLIQGKCLIHEAKPTVCALYPLGRTASFEKGTPTLGYIFQDVPCGTRDKNNVVSQWIQSLGPGHEKCAALWYSMLEELTYFMMKVPETDHKAIFMFNQIIFGLLYDGYNYDMDYETQFKEHLSLIKEFCSIHENMK